MPIGVGKMAIVRKRLKIEASLYTMLQIFSVNIFEKMPMKSAIAPENYKFSDLLAGNQLKLPGF